MGLLKPQRFKATVKKGQVTGVRQTNAKTQGVATKVTHGAIKKAQGKK